MATFHLKSARLVAAQYEISSFANSGTLTHSVEELDATTFGSAGNRERKGGMEDVTVQMSGLLSYDGTDDPGDIHFGQVGSNILVTVCPTDGTDGETAYSFQALGAQFEQFGAIGELAPFAFNASGRGRLVQGTILDPGTTARTATYTGTGRQLGSVAAGEKLYGFLHVLSASGTTPTLDVVVQSDDNSGFTSATTRLTFAQATATTSELVTASGAIADDWFRISATIGGTSPSFKALLVVGIR